MSTLSKKFLKEIINNRNLKTTEGFHSYLKEIFKNALQRISGIEQKVISFYARRMSAKDIHDQIKNIHRIEMSAEIVIKITDRSIDSYLLSPLIQYKNYCQSYKILCISP